MYSFIENLGTKFIEAVNYCGSLFYLVFQSTKQIFDHKNRKKTILKHIEQIGINSLPLVGTICAFTGMVLVMETAHTLKQFGAEIYAGGLVSISMSRELGPVIVALILAGRVGAAAAAEVGTMKITDQIDALEVFSVDPIGYLVTPRLIASIISMPVLFLLGFFLALIGSFVVGVFLVGISSGIFMHQTFRFICAKDLMVGIIKVVVFAIVVITTSCHEGMRTQGGAEGVGKAATTAVVISFFLIIFTNLILTAIFYFI